MANIHDCLDRAVQGGELDSSHATEAARQFDQLMARYETVMPPHQAEAAALADLKEATRKQARSRRHAVLNQLQSMRRLHALVNDSPDPVAAITNLIEYSEGSGFTGESVESVYRALIKAVNAGIQDTLREHSPRMGDLTLGVLTPWKGDISHNPAQLRNVVRELHGQVTEDATAKEIATAFAREQERMRQLYNAYGGDIGKLENYGVRHTHDAAAIRKAAPDEWEAFVFDRLDWSRIVDFQTGKPFSAERGRRPNRERAMIFLRDIRKGIQTNGWDTREASMAVGGKALYRKHDDARVLHFADGDAWMEYNARFGLNDPFSSMVGGLHGMARDIAQMRVLGPNPRLGLEYAGQVAEKRLSGNTKAIDALKDALKKARTWRAHFDGSVNETTRPGWALFFATTRSVLTSARLGAATLSAVPTDPAFMAAAAKVVGMNPSNVLSRAVDLMASGTTRETAARMGYIADTLADTGAAAARYLAEQMVSEYVNRLTSFTIRASLLSFWSDMNKLAFQMEFAGFLAENAGHSFDQVNPLLRRALETRGIAARDWDHLRAPEATFRTADGATFISPIYWREHQTSMTAMEAEGLAMRLQMVIEEHLEYAVPAQRLEGRATWVGMSEPGSFNGEIARSAKMFKGFTFSFMYGQYRRSQNLPTGMSPAAYIFALGAGLTLGGAISVQLKEMRKGNDPRPMDDWKFWGAAVLQGGGLGIFGDFLSASNDRFGNSLLRTAAGPVATTVEQVAKLPVANTAAAMAGENTYFARDTMNLIRYNTPVLSSLWQIAPFYQRGVVDELQRFLDPEAEHLWKQQIKRREREFGNSSWWGSGQPLPSRWPDFGNALGGQQ